MKRHSIGLIGLVLPLSLAAAELEVLVDDQQVAGVASVVYDAGPGRLSIQLVGGPPCQGQIITPSAGQLGLQVYSDVHAISGPIVYSVDGQTASLDITTQLGSLSCSPDSIHFDGFEVPG